MKKEFDRLHRKLDELSKPKEGPFHVTEEDAKSRAKDEFSVVYKNGRFFFFSKAPWAAGSHGPYASHDEAEQAYTAWIKANKNRP